MVAAEAAGDISDGISVAAAAAVALPVSCTSVMVHVLSYAYSVYSIGRKLCHKSHTHMVSRPSALACASTISYSL